MNQAAPFSHPTGPRRSLNHFLPPTPQQRDAVRQLNSSQAPSQHQRILDWLEVTRTVWAELKQRVDVDCPTENELSALVTLISSDNADVREWLRQDLQERQDCLPNGWDDLRRSTCSSNSGSRSSLVSSRKFPRTSSDPTTARSSASSFDPKHSSYLRNEYYPEKEDQILDNSIPTQPHPEFAGAREDIPGASPPAEAPIKGYRCSTGEHLPKSRSTTIAIFRRHEMEHVDRFYCVCKTTSLKEETPSGKRCILCRELNPDRAHFIKHGLEGCLARDEPLIFTRRDIFTKHLKNDHDVPSQNIKNLVKSRPWYSPLRKTAFTCGICVDVLFDSKEKQLEHITQLHLKDGQDMKDWNETKMMRSLLRHPEVNLAWNSILASNEAVAEQFLSWPEAISQKVPLELDLSSGTAEDFVSTAFAWSIEDYATVHEDNTHIPLQFTSGGTMASSPGPDRGLQSPSFPLHITNSKIEMIESFDNSSNSIGLNCHDENGMIGQTAMMPPMSSEENRKALDFGFPPTRLDSLNPYSAHASRHDTNASSHYTQAPQAPPGTISPLQLSTAKNLDPSFYAMDSPMNSPMGEVNKCDPGLGLFPVNSYAEFASSGPPSPSPDPPGRYNNVRQADAQSQQWSPGYDPLLGEKGLQGLSTLAPTSAPVKRKGSAHKAEVDGSERHPWGESFP